MLQPLPPHRVMECLAGDLHRLAFDMQFPSRNIHRSERIIDEAERIAEEVRRVVRG